jgi:hypothetical protein
MGWYALSASTNNGSNTAIGAVSMRFNTGGTGNTAIGEGSQFSLTTGNYNASLGQSSLGGNTNGSNNVAIGWYAGDTLGDGVTANSTPDNSVYIGSTAYASQSNGQNEIVIGSGAVGNGSNSVTLGSSAITKTILRGDVGIGTVLPSYPLEVASTSSLSIAYQRTGVAAKKWGFQSDNDSTYWSNITDSVLALTVRNTGDIGIGVTLPLARLHVVGTSLTEIRNTQGASSFKIVTGTGFSTIGTLTNDPLVIVTNDTERIRITNGGDVGIGTNSPQSRLQIFGGSLATSGNGMMFASQLTTGRTGTYDASSLGSIHTYFDATTIEMAAGSSSGWVSGVSVTGNNATLFAGTVRFLTQSAERARITNTGLIGIGTTTPSGMLTVAQSVDSGTANVLYLSNPSQTGTTAAAINFINADSVIKSSINAAVFGNDYMTFNVGSNTERVRINASGNVGINTTSPTSGKLQVVIGGDGAGIILERTTSGFFTGHGFTSSNPYFTYYATSHFIMGYGTSTGAAPSINTLMLKNTGQIQLPQYTTTTSFTGTAAGVLAFDSSGNVLTIATPGGGSAVTGQIILTAGGGWPSITAGAQSPTLVATATNAVNFYSINFADGSQTFANWAMPMPSDYNGGTITAVFYWMSNNASTNSVVWGFQGRAYADSDLIDQAFGTAQTVTDANQATRDVNISAATAAITLGGTPAASNFVQFRCYRDGAAGGDTLAAVAELLAIRITYTRA